MIMFDIDWLLFSICLSTDVSDADDGFSAKVNCLWIPPQDLRPLQDLLRMSHVFCYIIACWNLTARYSPLKCHIAIDDTFNFSCRMCLSFWLYWYLCILYQKELLWFLLSSLRSYNKDTLVCLGQSYLEPAVYTSKSFPSTVIIWMFTGLQGFKTCKLSSY